MKEYDWDRLQKYIDDGIKVVAGMREDWFYTASEVTQENIDSKDIAGIGASYWATPCVEIEDKIIDCYIEEK